MMDNKAQVLAEMREVTEFIKLNLWYVKWLLHFGVSFEYAIKKHVHIYRTTSFFDGNNAHQPACGWRDSRWEEFLPQLKKVYEGHPGHLGRESTLKLEQEGLDLLMPYLEKRMKAKIVPKKSTYGCFSYTSPPTNCLSLHFSNAVLPKSPFADMPTLAKSLKRLLIDFKKKYPEIMQVQCSSWLNAFPRFLTLFPPAWENSANPLGRDSATGAWGQFIDRAGGFHARNAAVFRKTGQFPYMNSSCVCDINELKDWLDQKIIFYTKQKGELIL